MLYNHFHQQEEFLGEADIYVAAYAIFLQPDDSPPSLEDDIHRLEQQNQHPSDNSAKNATPYYWSDVHGWKEDLWSSWQVPSFAKCFLTMVISCLKAAPACCLKTYPAASSDGPPHSVTDCPLWP